MTISTFQSQWGDYIVTQATLLSPIKNWEDGSQSQQYVYFETASNSQTVQTIIKNIRKDKDGTVYRDSGWGIRKVFLRPEAREMWKKYTSKGYNTDIEELS